MARINMHYDKFSNIPSTVYHKSTTTINTLAPHRHHPQQTGLATQHVHHHEFTDNIEWHNKNCLNKINKQTVNDEGVNAFSRMLLQCFSGDEVQDPELS